MGINWTVFEKPVTTKHHEGITDEYLIETNNRKAQEKFNSFFKKEVNSIINYSDIISITETARTVTVWYK